MKWLLSYVLDKLLTADNISAICAEVANRALARYTTPEACRGAAEKIRIGADLAGRIADDMADGRLTSEEVRETSAVVEAAIVQGGEPLLDQIKGTILGVVK